MKCPPLLQAIQTSRCWVVDVLCFKLRYVSRYFECFPLFKRWLYSGKNVRWISSNRPVGVAWEFVSAINNRRGTATRRNPKDKGTFRDDLFYDWARRPSSRKFVAPVEAK